jgi:hypothetical protein
MNSFFFIEILFCEGKRCSTLRHDHAQYDWNNPFFMHVKGEGSTIKLLTKDFVTLQIGLKWCMAKEVPYSIWWLLFWWGIKQNTVWFSHKKIFTNPDFCLFPFLRRGRTTVWVGKAVVSFCFMLSHKKEVNWTPLSNVNRVGTPVARHPAVHVCSCTVGGSDVFLQGQGSGVDLSIAVRRYEKPSVEQGNGPTMSTWRCEKRCVGTVIGCTAAVGCAMTADSSHNHGTNQRPV